ncbi:hypothetical protein KY362_06570 [Candidatus Woesearchaeota archaeon]|nr:hypothetical protein [Candidatus Woesearchaeota archaeon]
MGFMQKNVNIFLVLLVLLVAGALAGSSVYYQKNFDEINSDRENTKGDLSECRADLENFRFNLNKTMRSLNQTTTDIRRYDELYSNKSSELESTRDSLENTESELQTTKISLQEEAALKQKYRRDYEDQVQITRNLEEQNTILTAQKAEAEQSVITWRSRAETSAECISEFLDDHPEGTSLTASLREDLDDCR